MNCNQGRLSVYEPVILEVGGEGAELERYFVEHLQTTPSCWLRQVRMRRAVRLIGEHKPVNIIAIELGYDYKYPEHFTRDFKGYFGVPPSRFVLTPTSLRAGPGWDGFVAVEGAVQSR